ncbi:MAG: Rrf2 family transcriptional regulator [Desulfarculus sp.]|nr:Rrf2 family transcriptional regulator [Desulfarculus sp.]
MSPHLRISEAASLALHAMALLASQPGQPQPSKNLAHRLGVSDHHLAKVLQRLARAGLVEGQRGPRGGFRLAGQGRGTRLLEIYEAVEGPLPGQTCLLGRPACSGACVLGGLLGRLAADMRAYLVGTTLGDLTSGLGRPADIAL